MMTAIARLAAVSVALAACATVPQPDSTLRIMGEAEVFAPGIASTEHAEIRLTISPDGETALWFSRNRPGGPGGYDIWISRRGADGWEDAEPVPFNTPGRDFDPAFSADGRFVYFSSDRAGSLGGDDIYRVAVIGGGFGAVEQLGPAVNSAGNEWAAMISPDGQKLLFSSNGRGGAGRIDLFVAPRAGDGFGAAIALPGAINTPADEFDATFLEDGETIVFSRAPDLSVDRIDLYVSSLRGGAYESGAVLPLSVNDAERDTYGPMLDWSAPGRLTFSGRRSGAAAMELYLVRYRLEGAS
jgi:TolB protein